MLARFSSLAPSRAPHAHSTTAVSTAPTQPTTAPPCTILPDLLLRNSPVAFLLIVGAVSGRESCLLLAQHAPIFKLCTVQLGARHLQTTYLDRCTWKNPSYSYCVEHTVLFCIRVLLLSCLGVLAVLVRRVVCSHDFALSVWVCTENRPTPANSA